MNNDIFRQIEEMRRRGLLDNPLIEDVRRRGLDFNNNASLPNRRHLAELRSLHDSTLSRSAIREQIISNSLLDNLGVKRAMEALTQHSPQVRKDAFGLSTMESYQQRLRSLHQNYDFPKEALGLPIRKINDEIIAGKRFWEEYETSILRQGNTARAILQRNSVFGRNIYDESQRWAKKINDLGASDNLILKRNALEAATAYQVGIESLTNKIKETAFLQSHHSLVGKIIEPEIAFGTFARRTLNRIEQTSDPRKEFAYTAALNLATNQISGISSQLEQFNIRNSISVEPYQYHTRLNLFERQRYDMRRYTDEIAEEYSDIEETADSSDFNLTEFSPSTQVAEKARHLIGLILKCNEQSGLKGTGDIFKTTNMTVEAAYRLPLIIAVDKDSLGVVVDYLYFAIYEGAGRDNLRFITNGYLTDDEIDEVMWVKFLRNKWLRHDRDHGKESDVKKTWRDLNKALSALGFNSLPENSQDFTRLQYNLFQQLESFMENLVERIKNKETGH